MKQDEKEAFLAFGVALWMAVGLGMLFGFWWGWVVFPVVFVIMARYVL